MEKKLSSVLMKERVRQYRKGIVLGLFVVTILVLASIGTSRLFYKPTINTNTDSDNPNDNFTTPVTNGPPLEEESFVSKLSSEIQENYSNITRIYVYQNITLVNNSILMRYAFFTPNNDSTWHVERTQSVYTPGDIYIDFNTSTYNVTDKDVQELNSRLVFSVNASTVLENITKTYDPLLAQVYILIFYADKSAVMFFWQQDEENFFIEYGESTWYDEFYINWEDMVSYYLSPQSLFDPVLEQIDYLFSY